MPKKAARKPSRPAPSARKKAPARKPASAAKKAGSAKRAAAAGTGRPTEKQQFLDIFAREHASTLKVLRAFPGDQSEFRAHPRSQSARELAFTFVMEQQLISLAIQDQLQMGGGMPKPPAEFSAIVAQFDRDYHDLVALIKRTPERQLYQTSVAFPSGPGQMGSFPKIGFMWFMLFDQIHHRGQYSVMLRMAGGKVPAIYGPSADEPWF